ncbi:glycosyltransferase family 4 protein [soil metagenome]
MPSATATSDFTSEQLLNHPEDARCKVAVIWIDWYAYHVGRFRGILSHPELGSAALGIEMVGGTGVHQGLKFREDLPSDLRVETLMPESGWHEVGKLQLAIKLWKVLSRFNPEVVLVPGYYTLPGIAAALWAKVHDAKSVLMTESTEDDHHRVWWKEKLKALLVQNLFDWAVTGGKAHVRYLEHLGFPLSRIGHFYDVVENGVYQEYKARLRQRSRESFDLPARYFLYIGRLAPEKNVAGLIRAWNYYRALGGTWPLVLVGGGPAVDELKNMATRSAYSSDLHFAGHKGSQDLPRYYGFAGCFVLPSSREPWGLVVNEAMASGLPVIVSDRCGCAEDLVIPDVNGMIFDPANDENLTVCMLKISSLDSTELSHMGTRSREIIERYSPQNFGREVARIVNA